METIKVKITTFKNYDQSMGTFYYDRDLVLTTTDEVGCYTVLSYDISADSIHVSLIPDGKVPAHTPILIAAPKGTEYVEFEVQPKNTFKPIDNAMFGGLRGYILPPDSPDYRDRFELYALINNNGTPQWNPINECIRANKAFIPTILADASTGKHYDNLPILDKYYYDVTGHRVNFQKLVTKLQGKSVAERKKVYNKLVRRIGRINSCDDFCHHSRHEGKHTDGGHSFLDRLLYSVVIYMSV